MLAVNTRHYTPPSFPLTHTILYDKHALPQTQHSLVYSECCISTLHIWIHNGDDAYRAAVPYEYKTDSAANGPIETSNGTPSAQRCLTQPAVCTPLLLLQAARGGFADNKETGLAESVNDQVAWQTLLKGMLDFLPKSSFTFSLRCDPDARKLGFELIGRRPCNVNDA